MLDPVVVQDLDGLAPGQEQNEFGAIGNGGSGPGGMTAWTPRWQGEMEMQDLEENVASGGARGEGVTGGSGKPKSYSTGRAPHTAWVTVTDSNGLHLRTAFLRSGNMTADEAALGFPRSANATHTESRAVRWIPLNEGDTMKIFGTYEPCKACKGAMNKAANASGATITTTGRREPSQQSHERARAFTSEHRPWVSRKPTILGR